MLGDVIPSAVPQPVVSQEVLNPANELQLSPARMQLGGCKRQPAYCRLSYHMSVQQSPMT
jgi:hypothetical protein